MHCDLKAAEQRGQLPEFWLTTCSESGRDEDENCSVISQYEGVQKANGNTYAPQRLLPVWRPEILKYNLLQISHHQFYAVSEEEERSPHW